MSLGSRRFSLRPLGRTTEALASVEEAIRAQERPFATLTDRFADLMEALVRGYRDVARAGDYAMDEELPSSTESVLGHS